MFELNNLGMFVGSPIQRWLQHLDALPAAQQAEAYEVAGGCRAAPGGGSCCWVSCAGMMMALLAALALVGFAVWTVMTMVAMPESAWAAGPFINALPDEIPGCEGNAFYALHRCGGAGTGCQCLGAGWNIL